MAEGTCSELTNAAAEKLNKVGAMGRKSPRAFLLANLAEGVDRQSGHNYNERGDLKKFAPVGSESVTGAWQEIDPIILASKSVSNSSTRSDSESQSKRSKVAGHDG